MLRMWAFVRRVEYGASAFLVCGLVGVFIYFQFIYVAPQCFDGVQNGKERGIDCGGACTRICSFDVREPLPLWSRAFRIANDQYNAVAYVENRNPNEGTRELSYTFKLYDDNGLITSRSGKGTLPPNGTYPFFAGRIFTDGRTPTQTVFEIDSVNAVWVPALSAKEQFIVEKRQFKNADTHPLLNATIQNTSLEEAKNVEIIATVFDSKKKALTTSSTFVESFPPRSSEDVVFTWPEPIASTIRSCEVPTDVVLAIDLSGSMNDDGGTPPQPITSVLEAAESFVTRLKNSDQISVVVYATNAEIQETLTADKSRVAKEVRSLQIKPEDEKGMTNTGDAIKRAEEELLSTRHNPNARKVLVLLSDGLANAPGDNGEAYALNAAEHIKKNDIEVYTIGLGGKVNRSFMEKVASSEEEYLSAPDVRSIDLIYKNITSSICEDGVAVIDIIPKSPSTFAPLR